MYNTVLQKPDKHEKFNEVEVTDFHEGPEWPFGQSGSQ